KDYAEVLGEALEDVGEAIVKETGEQIVARLQESASLDLNSLYCRALFKAYTTDQLVYDFKTCVGVVLESQIPLTVDAIHQILEKSLKDNKLSKVRVKKTFNLLQSLLATDTNKKLSFIHKTVTEYLRSIKCHPNCAAVDTFRIDFGQVSLNLAHGCLAILNADLNVNLANLDHSKKYSSSSFPDVLSEELQYAVLYWSHHFVAALSNTTSVTEKQKLELLEGLHNFCKEKLPMYLEAVLILGQLNTVVGVVSSVSDSLEAFEKSNVITETDQIATIRQYLTDLKFIAFNFRTQLLVSPLQVYRHALIAVPQDTLYYNAYRELIPLGARLTVGRELEWGPFTLHGHTAAVCGVVYSADGKTVVSGSWDETVKVWDTRTGECIRTLTGHTDAVTSVAISADSKTVVSGAWDTTVQVWDTRTGECIRTLTGHTFYVNSVAIYVDGKTVVSGSHDTTVKLWDTRTGKCIRTLTGHTSNVHFVAISADGKNVVSGSEDKTVKLWDTRTDECTRTLEGHTSYVNSVAISADDKTVVSASDDKTVKLWDTHTGECIRTLEGHTRPVNSVAISADSKTVVSESYYNTVKLWDIRTEKCLETFDPQKRSFDSVVNNFLRPVGNRGRVEFNDSWITDVSSKQLLYCPPSVNEFVSSGSAICWGIDTNVGALLIG
ncbi:UNVERIFIED_CONTAM: hypothetical protein HDU68_001533, partial [Siphonaria sp. JEL0065]